MTVDKRKLAHDLTDIMARLLHHQERGEPQTPPTYQEAIRLPDEILQRYRNEPMFHAQVQRAVSSIFNVVNTAYRADEARRLYWYCACGEWHGESCRTCPGEPAPSN